MQIEDVKTKFEDITNFDKKFDYCNRADETFSRIMEYRDSIKAWFGAFYG